MTFANLLLDLYRRLGYDSTPAAAVTTRLKAYLNEAQREALMLPGMEGLRDDTISVASVADREYVALPQSVARIKQITDRTNDRVLQHVNVRQIRRQNPSQDTGTPWAFGVLGYRGVAVQPSDASDIFVDSTSTSDTNTAYMEGIRTGGYKDTTSVTMTGTTAVGFNMPDHTDWVQIDKFYLSAAAVGTVTLHEDASGGTELARIPIGGTYARYLHILLDPVPSTATTYWVDYVRDIEELVNDNDEPLLPPDFHHVLNIGARMKEYERREDLARMNQARFEWEKAIRSLRYWQATAGAVDWNINAKPEWSQLGSNFPAGT